MRNYWCFATTTTTTTTKIKEMKGNKTETYNTTETQLKTQLKTHLH